MLFIKDLPPVSTVDLQGRRSRASTSASCRTTTCSSRRRRAEFHYPKGDDNVFTTYDGTGGVPLGSFCAQAAVRASASASTRSLLSDDITPESRVLFHRRSRERVAHDRAVPDATTATRTWSSPTAGWSGSRTPTPTSDRYPYSTPTAERHQLHPQLGEGRRSTPTTARPRFYLADPDDPIARDATRAIFPGLFKPLARDARGPARARALPARTSSRCRRRCTRRTT